MRKILMLSIMLMSTLAMMAGGGKLVLVMEEGERPQQDFVWEIMTENPTPQIKTVWANGKDMVRIKNTPNGWFMLYEDESSTSDQNSSYDKIKGIKQRTKEHNKAGRKLISIGFEGLDGLGRQYFHAIFSCNDWDNDQIIEMEKTGKLAELLAKYYDKGYRITQLAGTERKWAVVLTKGTDIDRQEIVTYTDYDTMMEGVKQHWDEGWSVNLAEINAEGKYAIAFVTYTDGRTPRQYISVCSKPEEADQFISTRKAEGFHISSVGGSYLSGLLCNYDSMAEKLNAIAGITGGLMKSLEPITNTASDEISGENGDGGAGSAGNGGSSTKTHSHGAREVDCTLCLGSGRCKYCNGDGYNYTAGTAVQCNGCKGHIGKCSRCKGTGKIKRSGKVKY